MIINKSSTSKKRLIIQYVLMRLDGLQFPLFSADYQRNLDDDNIIQSINENHSITKQLLKN